MGKLLVSEEIQQKLGTSLLSQQSTLLYNYACNKSKNSDDKYVVMEYKYSYQMPIIKDGVILPYDTTKVSKAMRNMFDKINKNEIKFTDNKELIKELNKLKV